MLNVIFAEGSWKFNKDEIREGGQHIRRRLALTYMFRQYRRYTRHMTATVTDTAA